jgi:hypothetical protein
MLSPNNVQKRAKEINFWPRILGKIIDWTALFISTTFAQSIERRGGAPHQPADP